MKGSPGLLHWTFSFMSFHEKLSLSLEFVRRDQFVKRTGLSENSLREILKGRYPTLVEFAAIKRYFPSLKLYSKEIHQAQEKDNMSKKNKKNNSTQIELGVRELQEKEKNVSQKVEEKITVTVDSEQKSVISKVVEKKDSQYTVIESVDPSLAKVLLEGNKKNRTLSNSLVESIARDIVSGKWIVSHQGIALDKSGNLLDGQHRLHAIVKSGLTVEVPVTYNVSPESFDVIDMNNRPRTISDMQGISRGLKNARRVVAAAKTISALDGGYKDRYTNSEVDEILNRYQDECEWSCRALGGQNPSAGLTAGFAYAYPTNKEKIEAIAESFRTKVGMSKIMAALARAAERIGRTSDNRIDLAYLTLRAIRSELKQSKEEVRSLYIQKDSGEGKAVAYRSFRAIRAKMGLHE